jgi:hypothetical protein
MSLPHAPDPPVRGAVRHAADLRRNSADRTDPPTDRETQVRQGAGLVGLGRLDQVPHPQLAAARNRRHVEAAVADNIYTRGGVRFNSTIDRRS